MIMTLALEYNSGNGNNVDVDVDTTAAMIITMLIRDTNRNDDYNNNVDELLCNNKIVDRDISCVQHW